MTSETDDSIETSGEFEATPAPPRRTRRRGLGIVAFVLLLGGVVAWKTMSPDPSQSAAPEPRDVPQEQGGAIVLSDSYRERNKIEFGLVERGPLRPMVKVVGTVALDPRRVAAVGTRIPGFVKRVFKLEGDDVRAGDALAETESAELGQAQARVSAARAEQIAASANARREAALLADRLTTARESEEAAATLASREASLAAARQGVEAMGGAIDGPLGLRVIRSPIAGHVVEAMVSVGQSVGAHQPAFRVANLDSVWVELDVFERTVGKVRVGDSVEVVPSSDPSRRISGRVAHVGDVIEQASQSADVRVEVGNREHLLRPGQAVSAIIRISGPPRDTLSVKAESVTYVDDVPTVFVEIAPGRIVPTRVEIGVTDGARQEVLSGLREGARVVTGGVFALKSELFR